MSCGGIVRHSLGANIPKVSNERVFEIEYRWKG